MCVASEHGGVGGSGVMVSRHVTRPAFELASRHAHSEASTAHALREAIPTRTVSCKPGRTRDPNISPSPTHTSTAAPRQYARLGLLLVMSAKEEKQCTEGEDDKRHAANDAACDRPSMIMVRSCRND